MSIANPGGFEGSFAGDAGRIDDQARMECGVCWWIYEPALGDEEWQIPAHTPFSALPAHWRCPRCDAAPGQFMVLREAHVPEQAEARDDRLVNDAGRLAEQVLAAYQSAARHLEGLPVYNAALEISVVGPRRCAEGWVGVVVTPWCMNLFLASDSPTRAREGMHREVGFPSGQYRFTVAHLEAMPPVEVCSLFSPMDEFSDDAGAVAVATEALRGLLAAEGDAPDSSASSRRVSRRDLLRPSPVMSGG